MNYIPWKTIPDSKVHGANMGPIWGRQDPGGPHVGPMNFAIFAITSIVNGRLDDATITFIMYNNSSTQHAIQWQCNSI